MQSTTAFRARLAAGAAGLALATAFVVLPNAAGAQAPATAPAAFDLNIPAGPLENALVRFADATGIQLVYSAEMARGRRSTGVSARMSAADGLSRLLATTGLTWRFVDARTVTITPIESAGAESERVLGPVRVEGAEASGYAGPPGRGEGAASLGGVRLGQADESRGYRPVVSSVGSGAPTAIEDVPRPISVLTSAQIERQDIENIGEALRRLPGVTMLDGTNYAVEAGSPIYARGEQIQRFSIDGGASRRLNILDGGLIDIGAYDRIELVRGPNAVFIGGDSAGGTINFVRKRPSRTPTLAVTAVAGSWNRFTGGVDYSTPSLFGSEIAFRGVVTASTQEFFYDTAKRDNLLLYGIFDVPLTETVNVEFGAELGRLREQATYVGLPRFIEGPEIPLPRSTNLAPDWSHQNLDSGEIFVRVNADVSKDWQFASGFFVSQSNLDSTNFAPQPRLFQSSGTTYPDSSSRLFAEIQKYDRTNLGFDAKLTGRFKTYFLDHYVMVAADLSEQFTTEPREQGPLDYNGHPINTVADLKNPYPEPAWLPSGRFKWNHGSTRAGVTLADTISWKDRVQFTASFRRYDAEGSDIFPISVQYVAAGTPGSIPVSPTYAVIETDPPWYVEFSQTEQKPTWRPTYGLSVKVTSNFTVALASAEGSYDQSQYYGKDGKRLGPAIYDNKELSFKYSREGWLATLSGYDMTTGNSARAIEPYDMTCGPAGASYCYYPFGDTVKSTGADFEITGEVLKGLQVSASANYNDSVVIASQTPQRTIAPTSMAKLLLDWTPEWMPKASFQLNLTGQSGVYEAGNIYLQDSTGAYLLNPDGSYRIVPYAYDQDSYWLVAIGADYQVTPTSRLSIWIDNLTDEEYSTTPTSSTNYAGAPRSVMVTWRWKPWTGKYAPTAGSPPSWLDLTGWYTAADLGYHAPEGWKATSSGVKSDGSKANWDFGGSQDFTLLGRVGRRMGDHLRVEAEAGYRPSDMGFVKDASNVAPYGICDNRTSPDPAPAAPGCRKPDGEFDLFTLTANTLYDFGRPDARLRPYLGLGAGVAQNSVDVGGRYYGQPDVNVGGESFETKFVWQVMAGGTMSVTDKLNLDVTYRYLTVVDAELETIATASYLKTFTGDYVDQSITAGLRYAF